MCEIALLISRSLRNWGYESWNVRNAKVAVFLVQNPDGTSRPSIFKKNMHRDRVYKVQPCHKRIIHRSALQVRLSPKNGHVHEMVGTSWVRTQKLCLACRTNAVLATTLGRCYVVPLLLPRGRVSTWSLAICHARMQFRRGRQQSPFFGCIALSALSLWCRTHVLFPEHILFVKNTTRS